MERQVLLFVALLLSGCVGTPNTGLDKMLVAETECAPFARKLSGIELYGDAANWWDAAAGRYRRTSEPEPGGVLVFRRSSRLPSGHVAVVSKLVSDREIKVTQANWVHHRITRDESVVDVSRANDWTSVRVWWAPSHELGSYHYSTFGFIVRGGPGPRGMVAALPSE